MTYPLLALVTFDPSLAIGIRVHPVFQVDLLAEETILIVLVGISAHEAQVLVMVVDANPGEFTLLSGLALLESEAESVVASLPLVLAVSVTLLRLVHSFHDAAFLR